MSVNDGGQCGCLGEVIAERDQLRDELEARKRDSIYITPVGSVHGSAEAIAYVVDTLNDLETDLAEARQQLAQAKAIAKGLVRGGAVLDAANPNPVTDAEFEAFMRDPGEVEVRPFAPFLPAFADADDPASETKPPAPSEGTMKFPGRVIGGPDAPHVGYDSEGKPVTVGEHFRRSVGEDAANRMREFAGSLDRDSALAFLQKAGIVDADGNLTEHYRR